MCHLSYNLSYWGNVLPELKKKKIIIEVFIFSIISSHSLCQQNQNAFLSHVGEVQPWAEARWPLR